MGSKFFAFKADPFLVESKTILTELSPLKSFPLRFLTGVY